VTVIDIKREIESTEKIWYLSYSIKEHTFTTNTSISSVKTIVGQNWPTGAC